MRTVPSLTAEEYREQYAARWYWIVIYDIPDQLMPEARLFTKEFYADEFKTRMETRDRNFGEQHYPRMFRKPRPKAA